MSRENQDQKPSFCLAMTNSFDAIHALGHLVMWILTYRAAEDYFTKGTTESVSIDHLKRNVMEWDQLSPDAKNLAFTIIETAEIAAHEAFKKFGNKNNKEPNGE